MKNPQPRAGVDTGGGGVAEASTSHSLLFARNRNPSFSACRVHQSFKSRMARVFGSRSFMIGFWQAGITPARACKETVI